MDLHEELIECPDGRTLEVAALGDPSGATVLLHHGTPGSTRTLKAFAPLLEYGNFFLVTTSRAGYGRSSRLEGRNIASVVGDGRLALDHFGRDEYAALGWSGGGPHALACAALDSPRCQRVVPVASVVPIDADIDWTEGMGPENLEEFALAKEGGPAYLETLEASCAAMALTNADNVLEIFGGIIGESDRKVLADDDFRANFAEATSHAVSADWHGYADDNLAFFRPWSFDLGLIVATCEIFFGDDDLSVPPAHGVWLAHHVPDARSHHFSDEGHFSVYARHYGELADALAATPA